MKHYSLFLLFLMISEPAFSQQQPLYTASEVKEMPVFPGCEHIKASRKKVMNECMAEKISDLLNQKMEGMHDVMAQYGISRASALIMFVITKEGVMLNFSEVKGSNPVLAQYSIDALNRISMEIKPIRPAMVKKEQKVNLLYQMPITYENNEEDIETQNYQFPVDEIVLFTLKDADTDYEVRLFQDRDIRVFEIKDKTPTFLGRFLSMGEVERSEPYKSLIEKERQSDRTLVSGGQLDGEYYEIYIHNLFQKDKKSKPIFVEVEKLEDGKMIPVQTFEKEIEFNQSRYAPLIYRE
ncbi:MAG: hypothetical protein WCY16_00900 [Weeksellaceae bacterium]